MFGKMQIQVRSSGPGRRRFSHGAVTPLKINLTFIITGFRRFVKEVDRLKSGSRDETWGKGTGILKQKGRNQDFSPDFGLFRSQLAFQIKVYGELPGDEEQQNTGHQHGGDYPAGA